MPNKSVIFMEEKQYEKNREILLRLNNNMLKLLNLINEIDSKQKLLISDMESLKSYINEIKIKDDNRRKEVQKEIVKAEENINNGWWFGY
jgi:hypothetical protein